MRRKFSLVLLLGAAATPAQEPAAGQFDTMERLLRELQVQRDTSIWRQQILDRRAAEERRVEFVRKANRFVALWKKVMEAYSRDGVFNVKDARALSKAFRELEATGWPGSKR